MIQKILAIDDDQADLLLIQRLMKATGYDVVTASDGQEGWQQFNDKQPDLVILDIVMPDMNGWEICRRIRKISRTPVIMLSALGAKEDIVRGLGTGADDYMVKPFDPHELQDRVKAALARKRL